MENREFISLIGVVLEFANVSVKHCSLNFKNNEEVVIEFKDGFIKKVSIACDSKIAIIKDIIAAVE